MGGGQHTAVHTHTLTCTYQLFAEPLVLGAIIPAKGANRLKVGVQKGAGLRIQTARHGLTDTSPLVLPGGVLHLTEELV